MIALLLADRCTGCQRCAQVCPALVFETGPAPTTPPRIARPEACQTCFACELHCEADALYVDPDVSTPATVDEAQVRRSGLLGAYRRDSGWHEWADDPRHPNLHWRMDEVFARGREFAAATDGHNPDHATP